MGGGGGGGDGDGDGEEMEEEEEEKEREGAAENADGGLDGEVEAAAAAAAAGATPTSASRSGSELRILADSECLHPTERSGILGILPEGDGFHRDQAPAEASIDLVALILSSRQRSLGSAKRREAVRREWGGE